MALKNNLFPDIQFEEINDSPRPAQVGSINRIGIVGTFRKGPNGLFKLRSSYEDFRKMYDATTHAGSVSVQAAMDQGADDFGIIRVMGSAKKSTGTIEFVVADPNAVTAGTVHLDLEVYDTDNTTLLRSATVAIAVTANQTAAQIASSAVTLGNADTDVAAEIDLIYDAAGRVTLQCQTAGFAGNFVKYRLRLDATTPPAGVTVLPTAFTNMTGGQDGPKRATRMLQDNTATPANLLLISAANEGLWGDSVQITTTPGSLPGKFNLIAKDTVTGDEEVYVNLDLSTTSVDQNTDEVIAFRNSNLIRGTYVGSNPTLVPQIVTNAPLSGGTEGPAITDDDYLNALDNLAKRNVNIILAAGQTSANVRAALISQAETSGPISGFRIAVLNADKNMPIEGLKTVSQSYNTATGSAVMVAGWCTYAGQATLARFGASPDGFYAGHLAVTGVQVSPAARASSPFFQNVVEVDTETTEQAFNAYTDARMEAIILDPATGGFHCLNGRTLSSDGAWYWISVRRVYNQIKSDLFKMVQWVKSAPNTQAIRSQLAQQLDTYMQLLLSRGIIANTKASQVDGTNNPPDRVASGFLRAEVFFTPVFPADHVIIGVHRFLSADVITQVSGG